MNLSEIFKVGKRFYYSINIERDFYINTSLEDYILTSLGQKILKQITNSFNNNRAFTICGPYGTGKSAFALFLSKLLNNNSSAHHTRNILKSQCPGLYTELFDKKSKINISNKILCPILISGYYGSIQNALLKGLKNGLIYFWQNSNNKPNILKQIDDLLLDVANDKKIKSETIITLYENALKLIKNSKLSGNGIILIIDELGKFLEYAVHNPEETDIFILQNLAELAVRCKKNTFILGTILHQDFSRYTSSLSEQRRNEWNKIQGRFENIPFIETVDQILYVLNKAIKISSNILENNQFKSFIKTICNEAIKLSIGPQNINSDELINLLSHCIPLHPASAILLGPIFKKLSQNERSLFAFLTSNEFYSFKNFLENTKIDKNNNFPLYSLDYLYDYIITSIGSGLYINNNGKQWAEIDNALNRINKDCIDEVSLIKIIGLINAVGNFGNIQATVEVLKYCFYNLNNCKSIQILLDNLIEKGIVVYRNFNKTYALWHGSDIDIEQEIGEYRAKLKLTKSLSELAKQFIVLKPIVARRHLIKTGNFRIFKQIILKEEEIEESTKFHFDKYDGLIIYIIPNKQSNPNKILTKLVKIQQKTNPLISKRILFAVTLNIEKLLNLLEDLYILTQIKKNNSKLHSDNIAKQEINSRITIAEQILKNYSTNIFGIQTNISSTKNCIWFYNGKQLQWSTSKEFLKFISNICDDIFSESPIIKNEIINRIKISTSASSARKKLMNLMLINKGQIDLGIKGNPPEKSVYYSLLINSEIYRKENDSYSFYPPKININNFKPVWNKIEDILSKEPLNKTSVINIFNEISKPPIGLKEGPFPIILLSFMIFYENEIAIYEEGTFVPDLSLPIIERLIKAPEQFELQHYKIQGIKSDYFDKLQTIIKDTHLTNQSTTSVLNIIRPLLIFISRLPEYSKKTQTINEQTKQLRTVLLKARDPYELLFVDIPKVYNLPPLINNNNILHHTELNIFLKSLKNSINELNSSYDKLLTKIENLIMKSFHISYKSDDLRKELTFKSQRIIDYVVDSRLKGFLIQVVDENLNYIQWLESIATYLVSVPPRFWLDKDLIQCEISLTEISKLFRNFESVLFELNRIEGNKKNENAHQIVRLGITLFGKEEKEKVISISNKKVDKLNTIENNLENNFKNDNLTNEEILFILSNMAQKYL